MRLIYSLTVLAALLVLNPNPAQARSWLDWLIPPPKPDFERPYMETAKVPQLSLRQRDPWVMQDWIKARGGKENLMNDFYANGFITDESEKDGVPVIEVGQPFMRLSGNDKQQVMAFVDAFYASKAENYPGTLYICHDHSNQYIGVYSRYGLQLQ